MAEASDKLVERNFDFFPISFVWKRSHISDTAAMVGFGSDVA